MNEDVLLSAVIGVFMPGVVQMIVHRVVSPVNRFIISVLASMSAALLLAVPMLIAGESIDYVKSATIVFIFSQSIYRTYFKGSLLQDSVSSAMETVYIGAPKALGNEPVASEASAQ